MRSVIITPSYAPDFERCRILCRSVEKNISSYEKHIIIVDARDMDLFRSITGPKIEIVSKESILPKWLKKIPFSKKWWLSFKTIPVRGWILQQIVKLSVAECIDADLFLFADSDIMIIRPMDMSMMYTRNGSVRLYRYPRLERDYREPRHVAWYEYAGELFNLTGDHFITSDYIGPLVTWKRETLLRLNDYIRNSSGKKSWQEALCNTFDFSEYILYGIFSEFVLKEGSGHYWDDTEICHTSFTYNIDNYEDLKDFLRKLRPEHKAICIQSNLKIEPQEYIDYIDAMIEK